ncbi:MAG: SurA N-terminal domain-containing protein [Polyangiaceae bacterium]|nr:SurA N-terminal domain-containing protein [Polyangiaceae bacterium]
MSHRLKRIVIVAAILAIAVVFIYEFRPGRMAAPGGGSAAACVIDVAGSCVDANEFRTALRLVVPGSVDEDWIEKNRLRHQVIQGLIERELLVKEATRLGISVSDADVTEELRRGLVHVSLPVMWELSIDERGEDGAIHALYLNLMDGQRLRYDYLYAGPARHVGLFTDPKKQAFDYKRYERWVRQSTGKTPGDFRESQRRELIAARMRALVQSRVRVSEAEVYDEYARANERMVVDYVKLENPWYVAWVVDPSDAALAAWAEAHAADVDKAFEPEKAKFAEECRVVRQLVLDWDRSADDADAQKDKQKAALEELRKRITAAKEPGRELTLVVRERSDDVASRARDGLVGCLPKSEDPLATAAFALKSAGDLGPVVETPSGLAVVYLDAVAKGEDAGRLGRLDVARRVYLGAEAERLSKEGAKQILDAAKGGKDLAEAVDSHVASTLATVGERLAERVKRGAAAKEGEPATDVAFGAKDAERWLAAAREDRHKPRVQLSLPFAQGEPAFAGVPVGATAGLFKLDKPGTFADDPLKLLGDDRTAGYAVARLKERQPVKAEDWEKKRPIELENARRQKQRDALAAYVQRLRKANAGKIKTDPSLRVAPKEQQEEG